MRRCMVNFVRNRLVFCMVVLFTMVSLDAWAVSPELPASDPLAVLLLFRENNKTTHTLTASFHQEKQMALLTEPLESEGRFCIRQGNTGETLLWEYTSPAVSGFMYDNEGIRLWMRERAAIRAAHNQEAIALKAMSTHVLAWLHADPEGLKRYYRFEPLASTEKGLGLRLLPRGQNPVFTSIEVHFSPSAEVLRSLRFVEPHGDTTRLEFDNVVRNQPLPAFCQP